LRVFFSLIEGWKGLVSGWKDRAVNNNVAEKYMQARRELIARLGEIENELQQIKSALGLEATGRRGSPRPGAARRMEVASARANADPACWPSCER